MLSARYKLPKPCPLAGLSFFGIGFDTDGPSPAQKRPINNFRITQVRAGKLPFNIRGLKRSCLALIKTKTTKPPMGGVPFDWLIGHGNTAKAQKPLNKNDR